MKFHPATSGGEPKYNVSIEVCGKVEVGIFTIERYRHSKESKLLASKNGATLIGKSFTTATFKKFLKNSGESTSVFAKLNVIDLEIPPHASSSSFYKIE